MSITTYDSAQCRAIKVGRIVQMWGLTGRALSEGNNSLIEELADLAPNDPDSCDQPLAAIGEGSLPRARQIASQLPQTAAIEDYLHATEQGNPHWCSY